MIYFLPLLKYYLIYLGFSWQLFITDLFLEVYFKINIQLVYCAAWNYTDRALSLMAEILADKEIEHQLDNINLVPSDGGRFEFSVNEDLIFSKKQLGRHAEEGEVFGLLRKKLAELN